MSRDEAPIWISNTPGIERSAVAEDMMAGNPRAGGLNVMSPVSSQVVSQRQLGRSVLAVLVGMAVGIAVTLITDIVLRKAGVLPPLGERVPDRVLAWVTAYRVVYGIAASYLTAYLAPYRPIAHAMVGGAFGFVASLAGAIATWNAGPAYGPHWYPVALIVLALPQSWLGGWLRVRQVSSIPSRELRQ